MPSQATPPVPTVTSTRTSHRVTIGSHAPDLATRTDATINRKRPFVPVAMCSGVRTPVVAGSTSGLDDPVDMKGKAARRNRRRPRCVEGHLRSVAVGPIALDRRRMLCGRDPVTRPAFGLHPRGIVPRGNSCGIGQIRAVARDVGARCAIPRRKRAARGREPGECDVHSPVEMHGIEDGARYDVAVRAIERHRERRALMRGVRSRVWPGTASAAVTRAAQSASVAEVDLSVQVKGAAAQRGSRVVRFRMTVTASPWVVTARRRSVTVPARHRLRIVPRRSRSCAALIMAIDRARFARRVVTRRSADDLRIEGDFDDPIAVQATNHGVAGHGMTSRAGDAR